MRKEQEQKEWPKPPAGAAEWSSNPVTSAVPARIPASLQRLTRPSTVDGSQRVSANSFGREAVGHSGRSRAGGGNDGMSGELVRFSQQKFSERSGSPRGSPVKAFNDLVEEDGWAGYGPPTGYGIDFSRPPSRAVSQNKNRPASRGSLSASMGIDLSIPPLLFAQNPIAKATTPGNPSPREKPARKSVPEDNVRKSVSSQGRRRRRPPTQDWASSGNRNLSPSKYIMEREAKDEGRIQSPQRLAQPSYLNSPRRTNDVGVVTGGSGEPQRVQSKLPMPSPTASVRDYQMRAVACRRAGKTRLEGQAYYAIGILLDNKKQYRKAIDAYEKYLTACASINDVRGMMLACNCIGIAFMTMGGRDNLDKAIEFHSKHRDMADMAGKYIAHSNLGLCHAKLGEYDAAKKNHQQALADAVRTSNQAGESVACGNLAVTGEEAGDFATAQSCMERYLTLSSHRRYHTGETYAYQQLGELANSRGDFDEAARDFERAREIGSSVGETKTAKRAACNLGVSIGNMHLDDYMNSIAKQMEEGVET